MMTRAIAKALAPNDIYAQPMSWFEAFTVSLVALMAAVPVVVCLYLVKSAVGINLMDGPSPLHDLLYAYVR